MLWVLISTFWCFVAIAILTLLIQRYAALTALPDADVMDEDLPSLAVIIPARNELENIGPCLDSLLEQSYPKGQLQIIVVDDNSTDGTGQVVQRYIKRSHPIRLLDAGRLPDGWLGKPHACWIGANAVQADWLCFVDADTRHAPSLLTSAVSTAQQDEAALLSLHPRQEMLGFWERMLMPISFMSLMILFDARAINNPAKSHAMANGQFILIRSDVYGSLGGHAAIRNQVLEDVAIARLVKSAGYKIRLYSGKALIRTRMYHRLIPLWQGLARAGSELFGIPLTILAVLNCLMVGFLPIAYPLWRLAIAVNSPSTTILSSALLAWIGSLAWYGTHAIALRQYHVPYPYLLLSPLSYLMIAIVNTEGIIRRLLRTRRWKERNL